MLWLLAALAVFLALYNNVLTALSPPAWTYVPLNVSVAGGLVAVARARGMRWDELGLSRAGIVPGLRWGGALAAIVAAGLAVALFVPLADRFLADKRVSALSSAGVVYTALVRIPLGTVVLEEVAFRGVLYGVWSRVASVAAAVVGSSIVFGLWHIGPALALLKENDFGGPPIVRTAIVVGSVAGTAVGGMLLTWLRMHTGGIWAAAIVHAAANSLATLAAVLWQRG